MGKALFFGIAGIAGISAFALYKMRKAEGQEGEKCKNCIEFTDVDVNLNNAPIVIEKIDTVFPESQPNAVGFDATYKSKSCKTESFEIIADVQIFDHDLQRFVPDRIIPVEFTLEPCEKRTFHWLVFLDGRDAKIEFLVWRSLANPIALARSKTISIT